MSTRGLSALSNLGENIMGNWRITGFTGAIFGLTESGGFMLFYLPALVRVLGLALSVIVYCFGDFLALFLMSIF